MRDLTLEEYFDVFREFAIELQATTAQHNHAKSLQVLLGEDEDEGGHCNLAQGKGGRGKGKEGGKGSKGKGKGGHGPATITLGDKRICATHVLGTRNS